MAIARKFKITKLVIAANICPFDEWFETLAVEDQQMVDLRLARVQLGSFGEINTVGEGVWELKFRKGRALRIYYGQTGREIILILVGGDKRTQKKDIEKAKELFQLYKKERATDENH